MKQPKTLFLKAVIFFLAILVIALCTVGLPIAIYNELKGDFDYLPILIGLYAPTIPFLIALFQGIKLLINIDKNTAFSDSSVKSLKIIKKCAVAISVLFTLGMPYIFIVADNDDAPGVVLIGLVFIFAGIVVATFAAVLQKLLEEAVNIKSENELTV